jgi:hypothetical protein
MSCPSNEAIQDNASQYPHHLESSPSETSPKALNPPLQSLFDVVYCMAQQMANSVMMLRIEWASQF